MPGHALPSRQARRSTCSPSSMISPLCSAIGMNSDGGISPRSGCVQRHSASTPTHRLAAVVDDRLIGDAQPVLLDRGAQIVFQQLALEQVGIHRRIVDAGAVAALVLGAVERHDRHGA